MTDAHWKVMLLMSLMILLMLCFSLFSRPATRLYRAVRRVFWCGTLLYGAQLLGGPAANPAAVAAAACLGVPGLTALWWLGTL